MSQSLKKYLNISFKVIISFSLIYYLLSTNDIDFIFSSLLNSNYLYFSLSVLFIVLNYVFSSIRWKYLVIDSKIKLSYMIKLYFIGSFFNNFLPTSIGGDAYKILKLGQKIESKTDAFTATFLERFIGMLALIIISLYGFSSLKNVDIFNFLIIFVALILSFIIFLIYYPKFKFKPNFLNKIFTIMDKIHASFIKYKKYPKIIAFSFISSLFVQFFSVLSQVFIFKSLAVDIPFEFALFSFPVIFLSGYAIPSVNGIGSQEVLYTTFFTQIGITSGLIIASSFLYHIARLIVSLVGGLFYVYEK